MVEDPSANAENTGDMGFPRKNTGVDTISSSWGLPDPEIEPMSPVFSAFADGSSTTEPPGKPEKQ